MKQFRFLSLIDVVKGDATRIILGKEQSGGLCDRYGEDVGINDCDSLVSIVTCDFIGTLFYGQILA